MPGKYLGCRIDIIARQKRKNNCMRKKTAVLSRISH
jgi:hypothetical protein